MVVLRRTTLFPCVLRNNCVCVRAYIYIYIYELVNVASSRAVTVPRLFTNQSLVQLRICTTQNYVQLSYKEK